MKSAQSRVIRIAAQELCIHPTAQRALNPSKLKALEKNFDLDAIGVLHAVQYEINGQARTWVIDGQHRLELLMRLGLGEWQVEVKIHLDCKDDARASELFLKLNNRTSVRPYDKFVNARNAGHADAICVSEVLEQRGLKITLASGNGCVCCVDALLRVHGYDKDGSALAAVMDTVIAAWGRTASAVEGNLLSGLGLLFKQFNGTLDRPSLVKKLAKYPGGPSALIGDARSIRKLRQNTAISRCVAERILELYNVGRRAGKLDPL